jgi:hypothetical protein
MEKRGNFGPFRCNERVGKYKVTTLAVQFPMSGPAAERT